MPDELPMSRLAARIEVFPVAGVFTISRGSRTEVRVVTVELERAGIVGRGEAVPYPRYGETPEQVLEEINAMADVYRQGLDRARLRDSMPAGAARNALDCALWDLECKTLGHSAFELAGISAPKPQVTAYTISLGTVDSMYQATQANASRPLLKIKLGAAGDIERIRAVRAAAPRARLIVDANEGWSEADLEANIRACIEAGVELVEQPLPDGKDAILASRPKDIVICADESIHTSAELPRLRGLYDAINIKLDKTGGLTEALSLSRTARAQGFRIMVGCMLGTSLSMAPATLLAQDADYVDLDGPLLLAADRTPALDYADGKIGLPAAALWGS